MDVFVFRSEADTLRFGYTADESGSNLPAEFAPWSTVHFTDIPCSADVVLAGAAIAVVATIKAEGYYVTRADPPNVIRPGFGRR